MLGYALQILGPAITVGYLGWSTTKSAWGTGIAFSIGFAVALLCCYIKNMEIK